MIPAHIRAMASYRALIAALREAGAPVDLGVTTCERFWELVHSRLGVGSLLEQAHVAELEADSAQLQRKIDTAFAMPRIGAKVLPS